MKFTDLFIRRPVLACVISLLILLIGFNAYNQLKVRQYPKTEDAVVNVNTAYIGASADLVQGFITTPIQQAISGAEGISYITSSSFSGVSSVSAYVTPGYNVDNVLTEVIAKVAQIKGELPLEAEEPVVDKGTRMGNIALMYISFQSEDMSDEQISDYLRRVVQPRLATLEGVGGAEIIGARTYAMRLWLDPLEMAAHNITADEVGNAIRTSSFLSQAGETKGSLVATDVKAETDLRSVEEFRNIVIKQQGNNLVRLGDVARVELGAENYDTAVFFNGEPAVFMGVRAGPSANSLEVSDRVHREVEEIRAQAPSGLDIEIGYDASVYINASINEVVSTLLEATLIVILVVFVFLGQIRSVIIPVVTIPLSLVGTLFLMWALGYTINLMTLLALVLAIGLVVDDAIVVVENIHRHIEEGMKPLQAALRGAREISMPVISMTLTLAAVYAPIGFLTGITGKLFTEFAFTLAGAVIISGIVALTLSPMMCSKMLRQGTPGGLADKLDHFFEALKSRYQQQLTGALKYRPVTLVFALATLISIPFLLMFTQKELAPQEDNGGIFLMTQPPRHVNIDYTNRYTAQFPSIYNQFPEYARAFQVNGIMDDGSSIGGFMLKPWDERERTAMEIQPLIQVELDKISGIQVFSFIFSNLPGSMGGPPIQFVVKSTGDYRQLAEVSSQLVEEARKSGLFMFIDSDLRFDRPELRVKIDRDKAAELGISMADIGNALSVLLGEGYISRFAYQGRSYRIIPQAMRESRYAASNLGGYYVRTASGEQVPLSTVIRTEILPQPTGLNQFQQMNAAKIQGAMMPGTSLGDALDFLNNKAAELLPMGFDVDYDGDSRLYYTEGTKLYFIFAISLITIFLVLAAQFESFRDPFVILVSVPLSICGALIPITLGFSTFNIYSQIGLITLIGLISKHGILIVEFANQLQRQGKGIQEAVVEAASVRLRPILMTTGAMVLGVMPLVTASGAGAVSRYNIGLVIATGMSVGTLFTLFVVPVMYSYLARRHAIAEGDAFGEVGRLTTDV